MSVLNQVLTKQRSLVLYRSLPCRSRHRNPPQGKLLVCSARLCNPRLVRHSIHEPLTIGGVAYLARTALDQQSRNAQLKIFSSSTRKALYQLPAQVQKLAAKAFAGKVRGRLIAAAWAGEPNPVLYLPLLELSEVANFESRLFELCK